MGLRSNLQIWRGPAALASDAAARRGRSHWRSLAGVLVAWIVLGTVWPPLAVPLRRTVRTRTDGPSLNGALAGTGRLLAVYSLLLAAGVLAS